MALFEDVKTALRVSIDDEDINQQIHDLIEAAKEDLTNTADIRQAVVEEPVPFLVKQAIVLFVKYMWTDSETDRERLADRYASIKGTLAISSAYSNYDGED